MSIKENIISIKNNIPKDVNLVVASKTRNMNEIKEAYEAGIIDFGENKVQELISKYEVCDMKLNWHLIGHLQTNKVKYIVGKVFLIHSLDSIKLLNELEKRYSLEGKEINVLIQINIGRENTKDGILLENLDKLINECEKCNFVKVKGLMAIIPKCDEAAARKYFKEMKNLYEKLATARYNNIMMKYLSMGMTGDYEIAVQEGSNMIRIGEGIFGKRIYKI